MANELAVKILLKAAVEKLTDRGPTEQETEVLYKYYQEAEGNIYDKMTGALRKYYNIADTRVSGKRSASDHLDEVMHELLGQLSEKINCKGKSSNCMVQRAEKGEGSFEQWIR